MGTTLAKVGTNIIIMGYKIRFLLILMSSHCFTQNDVQQTVSNLISRMTQMELKSSEDTTAIQTLTEAMTKLQGELNSTQTTNQRQEEEIVKLKTEVEKLKQVSRFTNVVESCEQLSHLGITDSGTYNLDFDGKFQGQVPIEAHCNLPEATTKIGKEVEVTIEQCNGSGCFEFPISYDVNMDQIRALISRSTKCTQLVEFSCFSSPIKFQDQELLSWIDFEGNPHTLPSLETDNCNDKRPVWLKDIGNITQKEY